jgi:hypothetical protein
MRSRAKPDPAGALLLAHLLQTDGRRHIPLSAGSHAMAAIAALARAHQDAIKLRLREAAGLRFGVA